MFIGHVGVGLALKQMDRKLNAGWLVLGAIFADLLLWSLVLLGVERVHIPADFEQIRHFRFEFPYSHGLLANICWSAAAFALVAAFSNVRHRVRRAAVISAAVFSHFLLDLIVHEPEMPLVGGGSTGVGFSLWKHMYWALLLEVAIAGWGLYCYMRVTKPRGIIGRVGMMIWMGVIALMTVGGMLWGSRPEGPASLAVGSVITLVIVTLVVFWLETARVDRPRRGLN